MARRKRYTFYPGTHRRRRGGPLLAVLAVLAVASLVFIGWNIYEPLQRLIKEGPKTSSQAPSSASPSSGAASSKPSSSSAVSSQPAAAAVRGVYLPGSSLSADAISQTLSAAKGAGATVAVADLKSDDGVLHYASKLSETQSNGIVAQGAQDGAAIAAAITQAGFTPAARISCFKDPLAPTIMRDAAVKYSGDHSQNWLDANRNRWLNPYAASAVQYLTDVASELASMGFKQIYLDNVQFPSGSQAKSWFGDNLGAKESALQSFVTALTQKVHAAGGTVTLVLPADAATDGGQTDLGQAQDPYGYGADSVSPLLTPAAMKGLTVAGQALPDASGNLPAVLGTVAGALKAQNAAKYASVTPFIQAGSIKNGGTVQAADVSAELAALSSAGIGNYVLYADNGYNLSGVTAPAAK